MVTFPAAAQRVSAVLVKEVAHSEQLHEYLPITFARWRKGQFIYEEATFVCVWLIDAIIEAWLTLTGTCIITHTNGVLTSELYSCRQILLWR